jgi:hypothetical protein
MNFTASPLEIKSKSLSKKENEVSNNLSWEMHSAADNLRNYDERMEYIPPTTNS